MAFRHISDPVGKVMDNVIDMKARAELLKALKGSVELLDKQVDMTAWEIEQAKQLVRKGLKVMESKGSRSVVADYLASLFSEFVGGAPCND